MLTGFLASRGYGARRRLLEKSGRQEYVIYQSSQCAVRALYYILVDLGFPDGSDGQESTCNVGDLGLIPGWGRAPWVGKSPLEEGMATHSRILAWRICVDGGAWPYSP